MTRGMIQGRIIKETYNPRIFVARNGFSISLAGVEVGKMTTFDLWALPWKGGAWGAGTNMWHPETPASYESLPAPLATQIPTLWIRISGGRGAGALILDRCQAFNLFASVDAHHGGVAASDISWILDGKCKWGKDFSRISCLATFHIFLHL